MNSKELCASRCHDDGLRPATSLLIHPTPACFRRHGPLLPGFVECPCNTPQRIAFWHFQHFLGKYQFSDHKRSSPKLGALPKSGSQSGPIRFDWADPNWSGLTMIDQAWSWLIGFGQAWLGASPKLGLELGLMEITKITSPATSPHHHQGTPLGQPAWAKTKHKRNCSVHHYLLSIAVRDIVVFIFTIIWFIRASTVQQQCTIFWHCGPSGGQKMLVSSIAVHHKYFCMVLSSNDGAWNQLFCQCIADCHGASWLQKSSADDKFRHWLTCPSNWWKK